MGERGGSGFRVALSVSDLDRLRHLTHHHVRSEEDSVTPVDPGRLILRAVGEIDDR